MPSISNPFLYFVFYFSVSSLAWFMSNLETSFVTIGQRVLANPLKYVNLHFNIVLEGFFFLMHFIRMVTYLNWVRHPFKS